MTTYINSRQDNCYLSKCKRLLRSIYRISSSFRTTFHAFSEFLPGIIQYDYVDYEENFRSIIKSPHQSKWLVLQFYKFVNIHLGIMVTGGLIIILIEKEMRYKNILLLRIFLKTSCFDWFLVEIASS